MLPPAFDLALRWALTFAASVLLFVLGGRWLDEKLGTTPLFLLIGLFWALGMSFYSLMIQIKRMQQRDNEKKPPTPS
ncbi:MAG: AtpZ/AtpI family protein [Candidatus Zixiibacteriota bacterium]|nr:MAG: AtpZ/AtpI family protein [candidate division Zixibacteria bacterium]